MFVSPSGQRAAVCLGSHRSPRLSIVRKSPNEFHIRARCRDDLDTLSKTIALPEPVESYPGSDYPWRILCDEADLTRLFALMSASITYGKLIRSHLMFSSPFGQRAAVCLGSHRSPRLKSAIASHPTQNDKLDAYHDIHHRMAQWQARPS